VKRNEVDTFVIPSEEKRSRHFCHSERRETKSRKRQNQLEEFRAKSRNIPV